MELTELNRVREAGEPSVGGSQNDSRAGLAGPPILGGNELGAIRALALEALVQCVPAVEAAVLDLQPTLPGQTVLQDHGFSERALAGISTPRVYLTL